MNKTLPKDYSKKEIAGKDALFHITVKEVKEKILPEVNDEFATTAAGFKSLAELREAVRGNMKRRNEMEARRELEKEALGLLDKNSAFEAPEFMVKKHLETLINHGKDRLKKENLKDDEIKAMEGDLRNRLKGEALREVRAFFILDEIAKLENIKVDEEEITQALSQIASRSNRSVDEVKKYYEENNLIENLREDIRQRKVLDLVIKNANIS